jgi:hypothetical protein
MLYLHKAMFTGNRINLILNLLNRIIFSSVIVAVKYNEDEFYSNSFYSKVGGVSLQETNALEFEFIKLINYQLFVNKEQFDKYQVYLRNYRFKQ